MEEDERDQRSQSRLSKLSRHQLEQRRLAAGSRAASQISMSGRQSRQKHELSNGGPLSYRHDAPILNDKYFPKAGYGSMANIIEEDADTGLFKYPHLQLRNVSYSVRRGRREERILDMINIEARGGELVAVLATSSKYPTQ